MNQQQQVNIDTITNNIVNSVLQLGELFKQDKAVSNATVEDLRKQNAELQEKLKKLEEMPKEGENP